MKKTLTVLISFLFGINLYAQSGHIMQGVGAINMSMGGAATAQPLDINGALLWNPAAISTFDTKIVSLSLGLFSSSSTLSSSLPEGMMWPGSPAVSGSIDSDASPSPLPALAFVWGSPDSKHTYGISLLGVSGFGVDFPEETNNPLSSDFNPNENSIPINYPQQAGGFGHLKTGYMLMQLSLTYAYNLSKYVSIGIQPNLNYEMLSLSPNPTTQPDINKGYPETNTASAIGYGAQFGIFYDSHNILKLGLSYKTKQYFSEYNFNNTYLDGSAAPDNSFTMNYPSILSFGWGFSGKKWDFAADIRFVNYDQTEGFEESGWEINNDPGSPYYGYPTGAVKGFGWQDITIFSAGFQYKLLDNLPLRIGYTYNTNPIQDDLTFFSASAPAVITKAVQFGFGYEMKKVDFNFVYHRGFEGNGNEGPLLNPMMYDPVNNSLGAIPGSSVSYNLETTLIQLSINYRF